MLEICRHFRKLKWSMSQSLLSLMMEWIKNLERFLANSNFRETTATQVKGILPRPFFLCNIDYVILYFHWEMYEPDMMH